MQSKQQSMVQNLMHESDADDPDDEDYLAYHKLRETVDAVLDDAPTDQPND